MVDQVITIKKDTVIATGGQTTVNVETDFGTQGQRGGLILYGAGNPSTLSSSAFPTTPQLLDWYINLKTNDPEYLYIYQYVSQDGSSIWNRVFKIIPNIYSTNVEIQFSGDAEGQRVFIPVSAENGLILLDGISLASIDINAHIQIQSNYPTASSFKIGNLTTETGALSLIIDVYAAELIDSDWVAINGIRTAHITLNVI
jgi:hypothetical protein